MVTVSICTEIKILGLQKIVFKPKLWNCLGVQQQWQQQKYEEISNQNYATVSKSEKLATPEVDKKYIPLGNMDICY
jgi:hypothetical protein